jgi:hypothetical protein
MSFKAFSELMARSSLRQGSGRAGVLPAGASAQAGRAVSSRKSFIRRSLKGEGGSR